jgi:PBSX family phage terminase large subunit
MARPRSKVLVEADEVKIDYPSGAPLPYQMEFHNSKAKYRAIIGGYGSGKTTAGVIEAIIQSILYPNNLGLIGRADARRLKLTTMEVFNEICPPQLISKRNEHDGIIEFVNGSRIVYMGLLEEHDAPFKIKSLNLGWFFIDQAEEVSYNIFEDLKYRLRRQNSARCAFLTANPRGKNWIYKVFVSKELLDETEKNLYQYWKVTTYDNPYLPTDYIAQLEKMPPHLYRIYVLGEFEGFTDEVFSIKWENVLIDEIKPFERQNLDEFKKYTFIAGIDYGFRNPSAVVFSYYKQEIGELIVFDEIYEPGLTALELAQKIKDRMFYWGINPIFIIDPSTKQRSGVSGTSIYDELCLYIPMIIPGNNEVRTSISRIQGLFNQGSLKITKNNVNLIEELRNYSWKDEREELAMMEKPSEKISTSKNDHAVDALRYIVNYLYDSGVIFKKIRFSRIVPRDDYKHFQRVYKKLSKRVSQIWQTNPWI